MANPKTNAEDITMSYLGLRKSIGFIGLLVPIVLLIAGVFFLEGRIQPSISHFYYTPMGNYFVGSMCAIGVFLGSYRGYKPQQDEILTDRYLGLIAGSAAVIVALFPADPVSTIPVCADNETSIVGTIHFSAAALFLACLGVFSFFKFPRYDSDKPRNPVKQGRVKYYKLYGAFIFASLIGIAAITVYEKASCREFFIETWLFWLESIAVVSFGLSWLMKGEAMEHIQSLLPRR